MDWWLTLAGAIIGVVVGMTGMGGGALMTPVLVIFFGIPPLSAVSNDLVVSAITKPVGGFVHLRKGTVNLHIALWLSIGSVPCAFAGVFIARLLGPGAAVQSVIKLALGAALLIAATGLVIRSYLKLRERGRAARGLGTAQKERRDVPVRPVPTLIVGALGGVVVGMTSVGSGSLIIIALMALYPALAASSLVGTDLVSSVPLVLSAAVAHVLFGDFHAGITVALLIGAIPGTYVGARFSTQVPGGVIRRALTFVLLASGLKLLGVSNAGLIVALISAGIVGPLAWMWARRRQGLPHRAGSSVRQSTTTVAEVNDRGQLGGVRPIRRNPDVVNYGDGRTDRTRRATRNSAELARPATDDGPAARTSGSHENRRSRP